MLKQVHVYIKGDVIGVGFRAWTKIQSKFKKVTGWVRNNFEKPETFGTGGGVEALIQSEDENTLEEMVQLLKEGPPVSRVENIEVYHQKPTEIFENFEIRK